jgi:heme/copper-type cytochrome/quinol oxidase subunit 2
LLLLMRVFPRLAVMGQLPMAYLVGVGAAVAVGGAIMGTLLPQIDTTINAFDLRVAPLGSFYALFSGVLILVGVLGTLAYFHFGARKMDDGSIQRNALVAALTWIGRVYIAISFGVLFAGVYLAALTAFISRVDSFSELIEALRRLFQV